MNHRLPCLRLAVLGAVGFAAAASAGAGWQEKLVVLPQDGAIVYAQDSGEGGLQGRFASQKISATDKSYRTDYEFKNFNDDKLSVRFEIAKDLFASFDAEWGYKQDEVEGLKTWREGARKQALTDAVKKHQTQNQLNDAVKAVQAQYDKKLKDYMSSRGFRLLEGGVVEVDMPGLVKKHAARVASLAQNFDAIAQARKYESGDVIGAVTAMVQTAVLYKVPPNFANGVHTGGLWPPEKTLVDGWGDCDTKTGLLAAVLASWPKIKTVGLSLPEHYIMGIQRIPLKGDLFVEYQGLQYVLIEPAGPAWFSPGTLAESTKGLLAGKEGFRIDVLN